MFIIIHACVSSGLEVHTANRNQTANPCSVSVMLQWTKHNRDGQGWLKWGRERQMYRRMDRDRNRQTQRAWNHMSVSIFVCQLCFILRWEITFKCSCLHPSNMAPYSVKLLGKWHRKCLILHQGPPSHRVGTNVFSVNCRFLN